MKYISTLIFAMALIVSWKLIQEENPINFETHASIQLKLVDVIKQSILEAKPQAENIEVLSVSTEPLSDQALKAYFSYKYSEQDTDSGEWIEQQISGDAVLKRKNRPHLSEDLWVMESVQTQTGNLTFKNGIVITPHDDTTPAESSLPPDASQINPTPIEASPSTDSTPNE